MINDEDIMTELNRPLLSPTSSDLTDKDIVAKMTGWPEEAAERLKFLVSEEHETDALFCRLQLDAEARLLKVVAVSEAGPVVDVIDVDDMVGADLMISFQENTTRNNVTATPAPNRAANEPPSDTLVDRQGQATLTIYSYPRRNPASESWIKSWCSLKSSSSHLPPNPPSYQRPTDPSRERKERIAHHRTLTLAPTEDFEDANLILKSLRRLATGYPAERQFLVLCSPVSGPRKDAPKVYEKKVRPILEQAAITTEVLITTHAGHGRERMARPTSDNGDKDITEYDGIVVMGGDGLIWELVNGIMEREDAEDVLRKVKIGPIGCGTSNGLVASLAKHTGEVNDPMTSIFMIAKSRTTKIDLAKYQTRNSTIFGFLTYAYAMIADIDIESEVIRWIGSLRMDLWGALSVLRMRRYRARLTYLPPSKVPNYRSQSVGVMPATVQESIPENNQDWVTIEDDFLAFWASQLPHAATRTHQSPNSEIQDGVFKIWVVRGNVSRFRMALILIGLETGAHIDYPQCEFIDCCAFRLDPIRPGRSVLDGELIEEGPVQVKVLPASMNVFCHVTSNSNE